MLLGQFGKRREVKKVLFNDIYRGKTVLVTGHTGFKGGWLSLWLTMLGAKVYGYSLYPHDMPSMFSVIKLDNQIEHSVIGDILNEKYIEDAVAEFKPDIIFHLAAQPLVRTSYENPVLTYKTNVIGTLNVLEAARKSSSVKAFVNVTTDKCYENKEIFKKYKEDDELGGYDIYSSSKACSEILSSSYRRSFLKESFALATARAGNVIGGGDWAQGRLIPDCVRAINSDLSIEIRNPYSIRPWQFVLEPLSGYLLLGQKLLESGNSLYREAFNFGPEDNNTVTVEQIVKKVIKTWGKGQMTVSRAGSSIHEANLLMLDIKKAKENLCWTPTYDINTAIKETVEWYKCFYEQHTDMLEFTKQQITTYCEHYLNKNSRDF